MATTTKSTVIALALLGVSLLLFRYSQSGMDDGAEDNVHEKIYTAQNFTARVFDATGLKTRQLSASEVVYSDQTKTADFKDPVLRSYRVGKNGNTEVWNLSGRTGRARSGDYADLHEQVKLIPEFKGAALKDAVTDNLHYDFKKNEITSDDLTTMHGYGWTNQGTDFKIDLNTDIMTYKGNVNATYFPAQTAGD